MIGPRPSVRPSVCSQSNHVDDDTELQRIVVDCEDDRGRGDDAMQPEGEDINREQPSNTTHPARPPPSSFCRAEFIKTVLFQLHVFILKLTVKFFSIWSTQKREKRASLEQCVVKWAKFRGVTQVVPKVLEYGSFFLDFFLLAQRAQNKYATVG